MKEQYTMDGSAQATGPYTARSWRTFACVGLLACASQGHAQGLAWARSVGGQGDEVAQSLALDMDGNAWVAGYFEGTIDIDPGPGEELLTANGGSDVFVQQLADDGSFIRGWSIGSAAADYATNITTDADGNVYVTGAFNETMDADPGTGTTELTSAGEHDIFLAKYTADGALLWARRTGGTGYDESKSVAVGAVGNVYLLSYFSGTIDADPGTAVLSMASAGALDVLVQRFDGAGTLSWARTVGSTSTDIGLSLALDAEENIWFTGAFEGTLDLDPGAMETEMVSAGAWDIFVAKWSATGNFLWAGRMGGPENFDTGYDIAVDDEGNAIVVGSFFGTGDFDPGAGVHTLTAASLGSDDVFVQKLAADGTFQWAVRIGGADADLGYGVALSGSGHISVTGLFSGTADFDPDATSAYDMTTTSLDNFFDSFLCELDADGAFVGAWQFGGANSVATQSVAYGADGAAYIAGHFENAADFDPGVGEEELTSVGFRDAFVMRLDAIDTGMPDDILSEAPALFPNPAKDALSITVEAAQAGLPYTVHDEQGRLVAQGRLSGMRTSLAVDGLAPGSYHVRIPGAVGAAFTVVR